MKHIAYITAAVLLLGGCDETPNGLRCELLQPVTVVAFPDGSHKFCYRATCNDGCAEWTCRDDETKQTCRPLNVNPGGL